MDALARFKLSVTINDCKSLMGPPFGAGCGRLYNSESVYDANTLVVCHPVAADAATERGRV
ncbi:hypothetical protein GCM10027299_21990 [Larkinella ripae]